ncbi:MAG: CDP-glucose 4,6-dehydratase [Rhodospirillales bacterium]|nr:CDP-glucose 4,6-dehydratase [Rhodospirillales bacterium]
MGGLARVDPEFWRGRRVLITGHTGFKGAWLACILSRWGANVFGIGLAPETTPSLFVQLAPWSNLDSRLVDIRDRQALASAVAEADPEVVFHLAAQALVRRSYREPVETLASNVLGTVHLLDALRGSRRLRVILLITSDKVYRNINDGGAFCEDAPLGGDDPYSASKACAEIVAHAWSASGFLPSQVRLATARAGNVLGGGDFAEDRLICDVIRAAVNGHALTLRSPAATRPWQHVLDVARAYLLYGQALLDDTAELPATLNIGPGGGTRHTVAQTVKAFITALGADVRIEITPASETPEKEFLALDPAAAASAIGWHSHLDFSETIAWSAAWYRAVLRDKVGARQLTEEQIDRYFEEVACSPDLSYVADAPRR